MKKKILALSFVLVGFASLALGNVYAQTASPTPSASPTASPTSTPAGAPNTGYGPRL